MKTYQTAGDWGDICYALPVIRYHGPGILLFEAVTYTREPMTAGRWETIAPLLEVQPYIRGTRPLNAGERVDHNLNDFRALLFGAAHRRQLQIDKSLQSWMFEAHGVPNSEGETAWLTVPEPQRVAKVVINRSPRYHNARFPWRRVAEKYAGDIVFIGPEQEHKEFCDRNHVHVPRHPTANFLEAAQVIAGAELFIGNQSCCYAIAEGLKKPAVLEVFLPMPNCLYSRPNVWHGFTGDVHLPDL